MTIREKIIHYLKNNKEMTQGELAIAIYNDRYKMPALYPALMNLVKEGVILRKGKNPSYYSFNNIQIELGKNKM